MREPAFMVTRAPMASLEEAKEVEEVEEVKDEEGSECSVCVAEADFEDGLCFCEVVAYEVPIRWKAIQ